MTEIRQDFHLALDEVRSEVVHLAALVTEGIPRATEVVLAGDLGGAKALVDGDDELDVLTLAIEERCYDLLALQQPMAGDLRRIVTAIRMASEIERSGNLVTNIAKAARRLYPSTLPPLLRGLIDRMGRESASLLQVAIDAYVDEDADLAAALDDMDDRLDVLHRDYIAAILEAHERHDIDVQAALQFALVARYYERIGDHAVNIGERVCYLVTGLMPEHTSKGEV